MNRKFFVTRERKYSIRGFIDVRTGLELLPNTGLELYPKITFEEQMKIRKAVSEEDYSVLTTSNIVEIVDERRWLLHKIKMGIVEGVEVIL